MDAGELEETLDGWGSHQAGATGSRDELMIEASVTCLESGD